MELADVVGSLHFDSTMQQKREHFAAISGGKIGKGDEHAGKNWDTETQNENNR